MALLWADSNPLRHGTTQKVGHGVRVVCGVEFQPGAFSILLQQALAFQATPHPLTDPLYQADSIYSLTFAFFRKRRSKLAKRTSPFETSEKILDIGGYPQYDLMQVDGCDTGLPGLSYDICFSNSVIEHVGDHYKQSAFAREVRRLAPAYWEQTPDRGFFFETHVLGPFLHWLGKGRLRRFLCRYFSVWGLLNKPDNDEIDEFIDA